MGPTIPKRPDDIVIFSMDGPHITAGTAISLAHVSVPSNAERLAEMAAMTEPSPIRYPLNRSQRRAAKRRK